jgi:hypothetical protein
MKLLTKKIGFKLRLAAVCLAFFAFSFLLFPSVEAHRYHTSLTRIDYNEREKLLEISIQVFMHDLVPTLEQKAKKRIDLEQTPDVDNLILDYLAENFVFKNKSGEVQRLNWVGKEIDADSVWLYVEIPWNENPEGSFLQNTLFFEAFPEQTNLVIMRYGGKKADLLFKAGDRFKEITETKSKQ